MGICGNCGLENTTKHILCSRCKWRKIKDTSLLREGTKLCVGCKIEKDFKYFHGYSKLCNSCRYKKDKPFLDPVKMEIRNKRHQKKIRDEINFLKESTPCTDCNLLWPSYVMQFDHLKDKSFGIGARVSSIGRVKLWNEIAKCEIVCANCHFIRTHNRKEEAKV